MAITLKIIAGENASIASGNDSRIIGRKKHKLCVVQKGECIQGECLYYMKGNIVNNSF